MRQAARPVMTWQVGEALGLDAEVRGAPEPLRGKPAKPADRGWPRKLSDGEFTARLSTRTLTQVAELPRRHLKAIRPRRRALPPGNRRGGR
ncbi:hypothetical protein [Streptomyces griseochromogenes]|uniref:hypothetical protein n=1 Tax=Streptomyces griseochromogenes TaxID=68214 RepID=UPI0037B018C9